MKTARVMSWMAAALCAALAVTQALAQAPAKKANKEKGSGPAESFRGEIVYGEIVDIDTVGASLVVKGQQGEVTLRVTSGTLITSETQVAMSDLSDATAAYVAGDLSDDKKSIMASRIVVSANPAQPARGRGRSGVSGELSRRADGLSLKTASGVISIRPEEDAACIVQRVLAFADLRKGQTVFAMGRTADAGLVAANIILPSRPMGRGPGAGRRQGGRGPQPAQPGPVPEDAPIPKGL